MVVTRLQKKINASFIKNYTKKKSKLNSSFIKNYTSKRRSRISKRNPNSADNESDKLNSKIKETSNDEFQESLNEHVVIQQQQQQQQNNAQFQEPTDEHVVNQQQQQLHNQQFQEVQRHSDVHQRNTVRKKMEFVKPVDNLKLDGNLSDNWRRFKRSFDIFLTAAELNDKSYQIKVATFLNAIGEEALEVFESLNLTGADKGNYNTVIAAFENICKQKTNEVYERFVFYQRNQKENEPFDSFLMDIKKLVRTCEFGNMEENMLRDRIVMGVHSKQLQTKLLEASNLNCNTAIEKCRADEATKQQSNAMQTNQTVFEVNKFHSKNIVNNYNNKYKGKNNRKDRFHSQNNKQQENHWQGQRDKQNSNNLKNDNQNKQNNKCRFCNTLHKPRECPAYGKYCRVCNKKNHYGIVCRFKNVQQITNSNLNDKNDNNSNNSISDNSDLYIHTVNKVLNTNTAEQDYLNAWKELIKINGKEIAFKIDTGSDVNVLSVNLLNKIIPEIDIKKTSVVLQGFGGNKIKPIGKCSIPCNFESKTRVIEFILVNFDTIPLLGLNSCINFEIIKPRKVNTIKNFQ